MSKTLISNSVDPQEVGEFTQKAALWWDEKGPFKPLHHITPVRLAFIREEIIAHFNIQEPGPHPFQHLHIIDIGCGGGLVCEPLARLGGTVTGIDPGLENIEIAHHHATQRDLGISYIQTTAEEQRETNKRYDVVIALEIVEHVADLSLFIEACCALAKPNGLIILSTLNRTLKSFGLGIIAAEYLLRWVPRGTHSWQKFLKPSELAVHLRNNNVTPQTLKGMTFNPFTRCWQLSDDLAVNYLFSAIKRAQ